MGKGIAVDYDAEGKIAGIEILDAVKRFGSKDVLKKVTLEDLTLQANFASYKPLRKERRFNAYFSGKPSALLV